jgi:hypothetical protein
MSGISLVLWILEVGFHFALVLLFASDRYRNKYQFRSCNSSDNVNIWTRFSSAMGPILSGS